MTTTTHRDHHYSIQVQTDDLAILYCLRSLADYSQKSGNTRIAWTGTTKDNWQRDNQKVKFHFSQLNYRENFINEANRILPERSWKVVSIHDNDPAPKKN